MKMCHYFLFATNRIFKASVTGRWMNEWDHLQLVHLVDIAILLAETRNGASLPEN